MKKVISVLLAALLIAGLAVIPAAAHKKIAENFEDITPGEDPSMLDVIFDNFEYITATPSSACEIVDIEGGNALRLTGFTDFRTLDYFSGEYVFSVDIKAAPGTMANVFIRGEMPGSMVKLNPPNANSNNVFNYYEWDWYRENGGNGASGIGGSGIYVNLGANDFTLAVKKYAEDGLTVATDFHSIDYPDGVDPDEFVNIKFTDDGKEINVYLDGKKAARITLSEDPISYESDETDCLYYASATVFDAEGSELGTTENTRIRFEGSQLAIGARSAEIYADNLLIMYGSGAIAASEGGETPQETAPATEAKTEAPATEAPATEAETEPAEDPAGNATEQGTEAGTTAAPGTQAPQQIETKAPDTVPAADGGNTKTVIIVIICAVVVVAALAVIFIPKKKK